jgi:Tfp pilus assembly protein PilO
LHNQARAALNEITQEKVLCTQGAHQLKPYVSQANKDTVTGVVLDTVTNIVKANSLKLNAFRPQQVVSLDGLNELPYAVQVTGTYSGIRALLVALDRDKSTIVLKSVQMTSSQDTNNTITASLNISAYIASSDAAGNGGDSHE